MSDSIKYCEVCSNYDGCDRHEIQAAESCESFSFASKDEEPTAEQKMKFKEGDKVKVIVDADRLKSISADKVVFGMRGSIVGIYIGDSPYPNLPIRVHFPDIQEWYYMAESDLAFVHQEAVVKDMNPKLSCGIRKVPVHNIPSGPILELGLAFMEGHMKYGSHNYRTAGVRASTYYDAVMGRHMPVWWEGEDIDAESGLNHITKAIASLIVLRDSMLMGNWVDDRPIRYPGGLDVAGFNKKASDLIDKYPEPKEPYLEKRKRDEPIDGGY